jgi:hypothetical protein
LRGPCCSLGSRSSVFIRRAGDALPACARGTGFAILPYHYYEPVFRPSDLTRDPDEPRSLKGIDWNEAVQLKLLSEFRYSEDIRQLEGRRTGDHVYRFENIWFGPGDAEALYCMIRRFKPSRFVEIGCGQSTIIAEFAIQDATKEDPGYRCKHVCFEPYENPWLETLGIEVRRQPVEHSDLQAFRDLEAGDILFIDSSHVVRPMNDVEFEYLHILPILSPGVIIHVHDIFSPRDYPRQWLEDYRHNWSEQYLLEAFLSFNSQFEILCAVNYLTRKRPPQLATAFPVTCEQPFGYVGSFWLRRRV